MRRNWWRKRLVSVMCLVAFMFTFAASFASVTLVHTSPAIAQDDDANAAAGDAAPPQQKSFLVWFFKSLTLTYTIPFAIMSFSMVALIVMNYLCFRREMFVPSHLVATFETQLNEKRYQEAYDLAKGDESFLAKMMAQGLAKLSAGYSQAIEAMQEVSEAENMKHEHRLSYLAMIGSLAPMLGLLGTVHGMVISFSMIELSQTTPSAQELAGGISTALVTTIVGLIIALPAMFFFGIFKNTLAQRMLEVGTVGGSLMSRFETVGKK